MRFDNNYNYKNIGKIKIKNLPLKSFTILYVENSLLDQKRVLPILKFYGKEVYIANNGIDGLELFKKYNPDIIVTDTKMPKLDGIAMIKEIKNIKSSIPVIITGEKNPECLLESINLGVEKFLIKPIKEEELRKALDGIETKLFLEKAKEYNIFMLHQYKNAIDSSNIVSKTDINGIITYVNEEFCNISGYSKEELIGQNHNIVRHPDVPKEVFERFWKTILSKKIWKGTVKNRAKNGSTFYVNTTVIPIVDWNGKIVEFVAIRYDVTKSILLQEKLQKKEKELEALNKNLERRVEEQTKKLRELNLTLEKRIEKEVEKNRQKDRMMFQQARLASLGEMLGNIAHQWRQPLMELGILFYKIKRESIENGIDKEKIEEIYNKGISILDRMSQTIVDFQNFFRPDKKKEIFNIYETIKHSISIVEGSLKRSNIEIKVNKYDDLDVIGYKNEFSQVLINLINNAKDALNQNRFFDKKIVINIKKVFEEESDKAFIEVIDNGGGIKESILDKIFEPYFTTKHSSQGTGLGLYMSKMIIEQSMHGRLEVENFENGAKFTIKLPIKE
ncbi:hybrid sensor histidine kinase/response regulator [Nitrosophilus labii]|uniref:hybrid sensor histidine kinase/response regulator n=1 Tax=Nitrosophilus labii TaxID=2706014 RepID=UPI0016569D0B|nr:PAS domain S-box protein [Nitrosophilus labii]